MNKIRFHHYLLCRKSTFNKLFPGKLCKRNIYIYLIFPGSQYIMKSEHCCDNGRSTSGISPTTMHHSGPRDNLSQTILTRLSIPHEKRSGTDKAVIVKRLHYWKSQIFNNIVCRRRNAQKSVVKMNYIGSGLLNPFANVPLRFP